MKRKVSGGEYFSHITKGNQKEIQISWEEYMNMYPAMSTQSEVKVRTEMAQVINPISNQKFQASVQY